MSKVTIWAAKIEEGKYLYEKTEVETNKWIDTPPYATQQGVLIQDYNKNVSLAWVESKVEPGADGIYKISGLTGGAGPRPVKCYMIIPLPFEDRTSWNISAVEETERTPKKNRPYIVALEIQENGRTTYQLATAYYDPGKYSDWIGYNFKGCTKTVIAWREFPRPKRA